MAKISAKLPKFTFVREAYNEMKHVTWPRPRKTAIFTGLVIIVVVIFSYVISAIDAGFLSGLKSLHGEFGNPIEAPKPQVNLGEGAQILDSNGNPIDTKELLKDVNITNADGKPVELNVDASADAKKAQ